MSIRYPLSSSTWGEEELEAIQSVIDRDSFTMGDKVAEYERAFSQYLNVKHCVMVSSGSSANLLATAALFFTKSPMLKESD